jgi:hypothetical protein
MGHINDLAVISKDKALSKALELALEAVLRKYGKLISIKLDTSSRVIDLEILLKGESLPISMSMSDYRTIREGERHFITCGKVSVSREWMKTLAEDVLEGRLFEIPSKYSKLFHLLT